jgi:hypothetical protein
MHVRTQPLRTVSVEHGAVPAGQTPPSGAVSHRGAAPPHVHSCTQACVGPHSSAPHITNEASGARPAPASAHVCPWLVQVHWTPGCAETQRQRKVSVQPVAMPG